MLAPEVRNALPMGNADKSYVTSFLNVYGTPEKRHAKLSEAINPAVAESKFTQPSHALFVAHWGDSNEDIRNVASWLYHFKPKLDGRIGESIMVFKKGSPAAVAGDDPVLSERLVIETGQVMGNEKGLAEIFHGLSGRLDAAGRPRDGVKPPYARFLSNTFVSNYQRLEIDYTATAGPVEAEGTITVHEGIMPLDEATYDAQRQTTVYPVVFGNFACFNLIKDIADKVSVRAGFACNDLIDSKDLSSLSALPDLGKIFDSSAATAEPLELADELM